MREHFPVTTKDRKDESLDDLLEVKLSGVTTWEQIKRNVESGTWLRFVVTESLDIIIDVGSNTHEGILDDNGLEWKDLAITNAYIREDDDGKSLIFSYRSSEKGELHAAIERKILKFFKDKGMDLSEGKRIVYE